MTEREMIRLKIREEMRIQEEMDAQVMRREMHKRAMWQSSVQGGLPAPTRHQWEMLQHPVVPLVSPAPSIVVNQSYGRTTEKMLVREQARKANGFEERKKKILEGREIEDCMEMLQHPVVPQVSPAPSIVVNQSYGRTTEQRLVREQARKANGFEERKKKILEGREIEDCIYIDSDEESEDDGDIII
jgi:hypothetical protein